MSDIPYSLLLDYKEVQFMDDHMGDDADSENSFNRINEAIAILSKLKRKNEQRKRKY